jgi:hypothetical protein
MTLGAEAGGQDRQHGQDDCEQPGVHSRKDRTPARETVKAAGFQGAVLLAFFLK